MSDWYAPKPTGGFYARPFLRTPKIIDNEMWLHAQKGLTFNEIEKECLYFKECKQIANKYIAIGLGNQLLINYIGEPV